MLFILLKKRMCVSLSDLKIQRAMLPARIYEPHQWGAQRTIYIYQIKSGYIKLMDNLYGQIWSVLMFAFGWRFLNL